MKFGLKTLIILSGMVLGSGFLTESAFSKASTPFMPTWSQKHQLQRLVDVAGLALPMTHWPLPAEVVRLALEQLPTPHWDQEHPDWLSMRLQLLNDLRLHAQGVVRAQLRNPTEAPVGFGDNETPGSSVQVLSPEHTGAMGSGSYALRLGATLAQSSNSLERGTST